MIEAMLVAAKGFAYKLCLHEFSINKWYRIYNNIDYETYV